MTHRNWDNVRDHRVYAYLNQSELDAFLEAMQIKDIKRHATAARHFIVEHSEQVIQDKHKHERHITPPPIPIPTVITRVLHGISTVLSTVKQ